MSNNDNSLDIWAVIAAVFSLGMVLGVLMLMKHLGLLAHEVIVSIVLLLPLFVYLVVSGKMEALRAPGGWLAKFKTMANESLKPAEWIPVKPINAQEKFT